MTDEALHPTHIETIRHERIRFSQLRRHVFSAVDKRQDGRFESHLFAVEYNAKDDLISVYLTYSDGSDERQFAPAVAMKLLRECSDGIGEC